MGIYRQLEIAVAKFTVYLINSFGFFFKYKHSL